MNDDFKGIFLYSSNKLELNRLIDTRVDSMVLNPQFFHEVVDFLKDSVSLDENSFVKNPFVNSQGFLDSVRYLRYT